MDQGGVDAGLVHLFQRLLRRECGHLAVQAGRRGHGLRPDVDLRVDDLHALLLLMLRGSRRNRLEGWQQEDGQVKRVSVAWKSRVVLGTSLLKTWRERGRVMELVCWEAGRRAASVVAIRERVIGAAAG
jgi:hypothetical protein